MYRSTCVSRGQSAMGFSTSSNSRQRGLRCQAHKTAQRVFQVYCHSDNESTFDLTSYNSLQVSFIDNKSRLWGAKDQTTTKFTKNINTAFSHNSA